MRPASFELSIGLAQKFQIKANKPSLAVFVRQRFFDRPNKAELIGDEMPHDLEWYQLTNRTMSIEINESVDQFASSFTIVMANEEGNLSPDNYRLKWPPSTKFRGTLSMSYAQQLFPNTELLVYLGYGEHMIPFIHGFIEDTKISSEGDMVLSCMTAYKQILHQTAEYPVRTPKGNIFDVLKFIFDLAGVELKGEKMIVPGTNEEWEIKEGIEIQKGQAYDEVVRELVDTTFYYIKSHVDGSCELTPIPRYENITEEFDITIDEGYNLTKLDYVATDRDVYSGVGVKCGEHMNSWYNSYILNTVSNGKFKETIIECSWADTFRKRREVASAVFLQNLYKWRGLQVGLVMDPRLQLFDRVRVAEHVSSATGIYHIKGLQTMISIAGAFQVVELANVYDYRPLPRSNDAVGAVQSDHGQATINLEVKLTDTDSKPDKVNIYVNDKLVKENLTISTAGNTALISLPEGDAYVTIEGISVSGKHLAFEYTAKNKDGGLITTKKVEFKKANVDKNGVYQKRPSTSFSVRVN